MLDAQPFPGRALAAALVASASLSAGCSRTVVVPPRELPRLVAAQQEGAADLEVVDVDGEEQTIHAPVDAITIVPVGRLVFMVPPGADRALPVAPDEAEARSAEAWREVGLTVRPPFAVTADTHTVTLTQRSTSGATAPRTVQLPAPYVQGAKVEEVDVPATVGAALGITAGATALAFGTALLVLVSSPGFGM